jgi:hypothetical protein
MCYTCGSKLPFEDHGDPDNIVEEDLKLAGQTDTIKSARVKAAKETWPNSSNCRRMRAISSNPRRTTTSSCVIVGARAPVTPASWQGHEYSSGDSGRRDDG